jgi:hypothetical protein
MCIVALFAIADSHSSSPLFRPSRMQVKTKTTNDIVDFYYMWKKSTHYMIWKSSGKPSEPPTEHAEDRAKVVAAKMRGFA